MDQKEVELREAERKKVTEQLDEVDFLKLRLLNRNVDFFTSQVELTQMQLMEASRALMGYSNELAQKYDLKDARQVNVANGKIVRDLGALLGRVADGEEA